MKGRDHEKRDRYKHDEDERSRTPRGTGYGREQIVYQEHMARRWQGSAAPSPQAYSRALKQLRQLPGSVITAPTDLATLPPVLPSRGDRRGHHREEEKS